MKQKTKRYLFVGLTVVIAGLVSYVISEPIATGLRNILRRINFRYGYNIHLIVRYFIALALMLISTTVIDIELLSTSDDSEQ